MTFCRFDTQILTFVDTRGHQIHTNGMRDGKSAIQHMPPVFADIAEATTYLELVLRRACHSIMYGAVHTKSKRLQKDFSNDLDGRTIYFDAENCIYGSPFVVNDDIVDEQREQLTDVSRWTMSFHDFSDQRAVNSLDLRQVTNVAFLRMTNLSMKIAVSGMAFAGEISYDVFLPELSEVVSLARTISDNLMTISNNKPVYNFHTSIVPSLFIVLLRYRDPTLCRDALTILRMQQNDGPWDRFMIVKVGSWVMDIKEEGWVGFGTVSERFRKGRGYG